MGYPYCGAMKLTEALMGQDLMGFHPKSSFRRDGLDMNGAALYDQAYLSPGEFHQTLKDRKGTYLPSDTYDFCHLKDIFGKEQLGSLPRNAVVICDAFNHIKVNKKDVGMPILYYRASRGDSPGDFNDPKHAQAGFNHLDNHALLSLGFPGDPNQEHPLYRDPHLFYELIQGKQIHKADVPVIALSFILWSPADDGLFGTKDDIIYGR
jgi:hypothetical protein